MCQVNTRTECFWIDEEKLELTVSIKTVIILDKIENLWVILKHLAICTSSETFSTGLQRIITLESARSNHVSYWNTRRGVNLGVRSTDKVILSAYTL